MSGILINDNSTAVEAYNNLDATSDMLSSAVNKLSSGLQIQTAADDPAGYLVGQYLQEESNGYGQSISNAQDAVSVLQTAQGALNQEASVLQTMNTLATEAANGGVQDASTSAAAQSEFASLQAELDQIATSTTYGTTPLLGGTYSGETFQVGPYDSANDQVVVTIAAATSTALAVNTTAVSIGTVAAAEAAMTAVQTAISALMIDCVFSPETRPEKLTGPLTICLPPLPSWCRVLSRRYGRNPWTATAAQGFAPVSPSSGTPPLVATAAASGPGSAVARPGRGSPHPTARGSGPR